MAAARQGLPVRLDRAPQRGAAFPQTRASRRARTRSIGSRSRATGNLHQQGLDTTTPAGKAMFQMMGVFAEFERAMIQERVRAGLARARSEGKRLGRPRIDGTTESAILAALKRKDRPGVRKIAVQLGVSPGTVMRVSRQLDQAIAG